MESASSAIQIFMWLYMVSFYIEASAETRRQRLPYLGASLFILLLFTTASIIEGIGTYRLLFESSPGAENANAVIPLFAKYAKGPGVTVKGLTADWSFRFADLVLLYRCYIVWYNHRWVTILPLCVWIASGAINLRSYFPIGFSDIRLNGADTILLVMVNVIATALMSFRLIKAQKQLTSVLPNADHKGYLGIVGILVESAAPAALVGTATSIANFCTDTSYIAFQTFGVLQIFFGSVLVLAPQLIIFRVATGTSWANKDDTTVMFSQPIAFNNGTQSARTDDEESGSGIETARC